MTTDACSTAEARAVAHAVSRGNMIACGALMCAGAALVTPFILRYDLVLLAICGGASALPLLLLTGLPSVESMPLLAVSVLLALLYWVFLGNAYESGDVSIVFPLAYGSAPALVLLLTCLFINEIPSANQLAVS